MSQNEIPKTKSQEQLAEAKDSQEKMNLVIIETAPSSLIQDVLCREEYENLFKGLLGLVQKQ